LPAGREAKRAHSCIIFGGSRDPSEVLESAKEVQMEGDACAHLDGLTTIKKPRRRQCDECVKIGAKWVHLRTCQTCAATLCCDSSPNRHASKHARGSGHPVIASAEPGERWLYCYPDDLTVEY
jgi:hypothetical protein